MANEKLKDKGLDGALLDAQAAIQNVAKDSHNKFSNYDYTSAEAIIGACRDALHGAGLVARRITWSIATEPYYTDADGYREFKVESTFRICHPASGMNEDHVVPFPAIERKGMPIDKAIAAALTSCWAYWLRDLLAVPRAAEEMDKRDDSKHEARKPSRLTKEEMSIVAECNDMMDAAKSPEDLASLGREVFSAQSYRIKAEIKPRYDRRMQALKTEAGENTAMEHAAAAAT